MPSVPILPFMLETDGHGIQERLARWLYRLLASAIVASILLVELWRIRGGMIAADA